MNNLNPSLVWGLLGPDFSLRLTLTLFHFLWQGCVLGLLGAAAGRCLQSASSRARHAVFVAILLLMGSTVCGTYWLTAREKSQPAAPAPSISSIPIASNRTAKMPRLGPALVSETVPDLRRASTPSSDRTEGTSPLASAPSTASAPTGRGIDAYAPFVVIAYLLGALLMLARLTLALWGGRRLRLSAVPIQEGALVAAVSRQAARIGLRVVPIVAWCRRTSVPVVAGIFRPMILLPATLATGLDSAQLEALITHELAHIRRYDPLVNVLQRLIEATLFFHPAVWYISRRISAEREDACDDLVLSAGWPAANYAQALLDMAELCAGPLALAREGALLGASGSGSSQFKRRVLRLLEIDDAPRVRLSRGGALLLMAAAVLLLTTPALILPLTGRDQQAVAAESDCDATKDPAASAGEKRDLYGDPLPAGALLRLGTVRLRHPQVVTSVAFSPNGQMLATATWNDPQIRLWDVRTGRLIRAFHGSNSDRPRQLAFSPNGAKLVVVCGPGGVQLWDVASGLELRETKYANADEGPRSVAFSPDGRSFATAGSQGEVRLWDADGSGRERLVMNLGLRFAGPLPLAFSPDGNLLACATTKEIHLLDLIKGIEVGTMKNLHGEEITRRVEFGPEGKTLFSAGDAGLRIMQDGKKEWANVPQLRLWDVAQRKLIREFVDPALEPGHCAFALSRDGRTLASMQTNSILLWDVATGKVTRSIRRHRIPSIARDETVSFHFPLASPGIALSPDMTMIATADQPLHSVTLWDVATGQRKLDFPDTPSAHVLGLACSSDGALIATGSRDGTVQLWESATGKPLRTLALSDSSWCEVHSIAFARDGQSLAAGGEDRQTELDRGRARIWDLKSGAQRLEIRTDQEVAKIALSHDGSALAVATSNLNSFASRSTKGGRQVEQEPEHWLLIVDAKTGAQRQRIKLVGYARALAFSPTGATIIAAEHTGALSAWDTATGQLLRTSDAYEGAVSNRLNAMFSAATSGDGSLAIMVNALSQDPATLWDLTTGKQIGKINFENASDIASVVAISPDNQVIASAIRGGTDPSSEKHSLRLWDARTGKLLKRQPLSRVASLEFTPDGRRLISGMSDGSSLIWDVSSL